VYENGRFMTTPPNPWVVEWGRVLSRRQVRRMSRRFAGVGVGIVPARLQEIAAGRPIADDESTDLNFALAATQILREQRLAKFARGRRRAMQWLILAGLVPVTLNMLICMTYPFFSLAQPASF
jgi:hypothetical protein